MLLDAYDHGAVHSDTYDWRQLPAAGTEIRHGSLFVWPDIGPGQPNNVRAQRGPGSPYLARCSTLERMRVASLFVHPVKGCRAVQVTSARVEPWGLVGDRRWMVVDEDGRFQSQREVPVLATVVAQLTDDGIELTAPGFERLAVKEPESAQGLADVRVWRSDFRAVEAAPEAHAWFSELLGNRARLVWLDDPYRRPPHPDFGTPATFADGFPLLATNVSSLADLNARLAATDEPPLPMTRFRPNIVISGAPAWAEDDWTTLHLPAVDIAVTTGCGRCVVTTTDQLTGERMGKQPLKILATFRLVEKKMLFGVNLTPLHPGIISVGDELT